MRREMAIDEAIRAFKSGRVTLREFADALTLSIWEAHDLLAVKGVSVAQGDRSETRSNFESVLKSMSRKSRKRNS